MNTVWQIDSMFGSLLPNNMVNILFQSHEAIVILIVCKFIHLLHTQRFKIISLFLVHKLSTRFQNLWPDLRKVETKWFRLIKNYLIIFLVSLLSLLSWCVFWFAHSTMLIPNSIMGVIKWGHFVETMPLGWAFFFCVTPFDWYFDFVRKSSLRFFWTTKRRF